MQKIKSVYFENYGQNKEDVNVVEKQLNKTRSSGYFKGKNDVSIYFEKYIVNNEKGRIVISHGFTECIQKYNELIFYFNENGYSVFMAEHRGHGRSGFLGKMSESQVNIENFDYYIEDLKAFIDEIVFEEGANMYLYAHSLGGAIATLFLERYSGYFKKAILSAPMMAINTGNYSEKVTYIISEIFMKIGKGDNFIFGHKPFEEIYDFENAATSNEYRYKTHFECLVKNKELQRSGGSFRWLNESLKATKGLLKEENIKKIDIPILLFQAGKDTFVKPEGQNRFKELAKNCEIIRFENGKHELYLENDEILQPYLNKVLEFLG